MLKFERPPLVEAIFEAQVSGSPGWSQLSERNVQDRLREVFDGPQDHTKPFHMMVTVGPHGVAQQVAQPPPRLRLWTKNRAQMFQFDPTLCAFNILGAYTKFEEHLARLEQVVGAYFEETKPPSVEWIGQRYVNKVELPAVQINPADFFTFYPRLPRAAEHRPFAMQVAVESTDAGDVVLNLNFRGIEDDKALYFLDLYVRSKKEIAPSVKTVVAWQVEAHEAVRRAFKMALTEKAFLSFRGEQ